MRGDWRELDLLRGLAALLMILNHAGVQWYGEAPVEGTIEGALTSLGRFAPVGFFLVTGLGYGVSPARDASAGPSAHRYGLWNKVAVLFVADGLLTWSHGHWLGLDFLGFIALSMLVLEGVRATRSPVPVALVAIVLCWGVRFVLGPIWADHARGPTSEAVRAWTGTRGVAGFSYGPFPWMVYPLLGFVLGRWARDHRGTRRELERAAVVRLLPVAIAALGAAGGLAVLGRPALRFGVVTIAFFVQSLAFVAASLLVVLVVTGRPGGADRSSVLRLRGISSLAVVPVHYVVLFALGATIVRDPGGPAFAFWATVACALSFVLARRFEVATRVMAGRESTGPLWLGLAGLTLAAAACLAPALEAPAGIRVLALGLGQLASCGLLQVRLPLPVRAMRPAPAPPARRSGRTRGGAARSATSGAWTSRP